MCISDTRRTTQTGLLRRSAATYVNNNIVSVGGAFKISEVTVLDDQSHLDDKYFIDTKKYNCPFCKRNHVSYHLVTRQVFDWNDSKKCRAYFAKCESCEKISMHLTFEELGLQRIQDTRYRFGKDLLGKRDIDENIFYSVPTSSFTLDPNIPREIRELLTEAEQCLNSNLLTGGSACARKVVYEITQREEQAQGDDYEERIKSLKIAYDDIDPTFFDSLLSIQKVTSDKVHENAYDGWQAEHLRLILASLRQILKEIYVEPARRKERREKILDFQQEVLGDEGES